MTPQALFSNIANLAGLSTVSVCLLHSACRQDKGHTFLCGKQASVYPVIDFDSVKDDIDRGGKLRKSVDALALSPSKERICFIELKSWEMLLQHNADEEKIEKKGKQYKSDLPEKLTCSMTICQEIAGHDALKGIEAVFILLSDIDVNHDALAALVTDLESLSGTSSDLKALCNKMSYDALADIRSVETRYWQCRQFDSEILSL